MKPLNTNRYNQLTPSCTLDNGAVVSTPFYISITTDQAKLLLNRFREVRTAQLIEMGCNPQSESRSGLVVETAQSSMQTQVELQIGMNEESLRMCLFSRSGIQEKVILNICRVLDTPIVTKQEMIDTYTQWVDAMFPDKVTRGGGKKKELVTA